MEFVLYVALTLFILAVAFVFVALGVSLLKMD